MPSPYGAPWQGHVCFDLSLDDFLVAVEPGITHKALNSHLQGTELWFPTGTMVHQGSSYNLILIIVGSKGTLGFIMEAMLHLYPLAEATTTFPQHP